MEKFSYKLMKCGLFQEVRKMTYGYGLLLKEEQGLLSKLISGKEMMLELPPCGAHFLKTAKRTEFFYGRLVLLWKNLSGGKAQSRQQRKRKKSHIERINLTFRQRLSALVRKTLSFSRRIENLTAYVWIVINYYNDFILFR
jgi:hypothetical protein